MTRSTTAAPRLQIEYLPPNSLVLNPNNPRVHSKAHIGQLSKSLKEFGFKAPVLIDEHDMVIAGHGRTMAACDLGLAHIPVIRVKDLSPEQVKAYVIADNRLSEHSTWDEALLAQSFKEMLQVDLSFDLSITGFELAEIDLKIQHLDDAAIEEEEPVGALQAVAVSRHGDRWELGRHRLLCASALEPASYELLLADRAAHIVFTDPPYNVPIAGHVSGKGKVRHREFAMASGEKTPEEFTTFLHQFTTLAAAHSAEGSIHFICMDWRHLPELMTAAGSVYSELKNLAVWAKDSAGMGSLYRSQHELVLIYKKGTAPHVNNVQLGRFGRSRSNVWRYPGANSFARSTGEGQLLALHPTVKPVAMVADALSDCSNRGDIVLDPFLGSGTTLMAAERTGRICCATELDPLYVDLAIRRWQKATGKPALNAITGLNFDQQLAASGSSKHG
jgi:ParB-like chromosome segregation protein Spo0J